MYIYDIGFVQCIKDISNFFKFRREMRREFSHRDSKFNKLGLQLNWLKNVVYTQLNCTEEDLMNFGYDEEAMIMKKIQPIVEYLGTELGWSDYLSPQISNFVDENGEQTLSYGIIFVFTPYRLTFTRAIINAIVSCGIIGVGIWAILKFLV
jgi:hypothetical protein